MGPDMAAEMARRLLVEAMVLSAPVLLAACLVSVALSLLQTLTSVQEQTLTVVPRLIVVFAVTVAAMPWFVRRLVTYTVGLWGDFHRYLG
ncbi:MAG: flagellar biosynthetic protein FliQ [Acidobacteriaceae bacterium]|jgi:flagellar biosynthetic protein FliQ